MQLPEHRPQQRISEDFLGRDPNDAARVARKRCRGFGESFGCRFDLPGAFDKFFTGGGQGVAGLALFEEQKAKRFLERGDPAGDDDIIRVVGEGIFDESFGGNGESFGTIEGDGTFISAVGLHIRANLNTPTRHIFDGQFLVGTAGVPSDG